MSIEFEAGDIVVCIDESSTLLSAGSEYTIDRTSHLGSVKLVGYADWLAQSRFSKVEPPSVVVGTGMKFDGAKARMDLLVDGCPNALEAVGKVLTFGAQKYAAHSWQTVEGGEERYKAALIRHLLAVGKGESVDPESGLSHLAHLACNALFILELELRKCKE